MFKWIKNYFTKVVEVEAEKIVKVLVTPEKGEITYDKIVWIVTPNF